MSPRLCVDEPELSSIDSMCSPDDGQADNEWLNNPGKEDTGLTNLCINTIRFLCVDAINHANSGHPGICMGMAAAAFVLFDKHMKFNPKNPNWVNRDRFVLSAGHGSMLLYSLLHLYGYDSVSMEDIKKFRKIHSKTPGHPECMETSGVEVCTGPLGQGICNAVGIAMSETHVAAQYNRPGFPIIDNYTYCIAGDGCMMEGMSGEAASLAGHLRLGKLIVLYDDNHISIDGSTDLAFSEDVSKRFEAYGWQVIHVKEGSWDVEAIDSAIEKAKTCSDKPSLIKITTTIGYGAPTKSNSAAAHGAALGFEETEAAKKKMEYPYEAFEVPSSARMHFDSMAKEGQAKEDGWRSLSVKYEETYSELYEQFQSAVVRGESLSEVAQSLRTVALGNREKSMATRKHSKTMLNTIAPQLRGFIGGSADTSPSTLTNLDCSVDFTSCERTGRNIRFGVREHGMGAISNGMFSAGYNLRPFCSTFFVFTDYMRAAMRMASMSEIGTIFVMTHDSIGLGEDGPSHQPIEHLMSFRAMPNHDVWRPADSVETGAAYESALYSKNRPSTIVLSRQSTAALKCTCYDGALRGGYVAWERSGNRRLDGIIIGTGSELALAVRAAEELDRRGVHARVVSLPSWEAFERQGSGYHKEVLCLGRERIVAVEAGCSLGWSRYADYTVSVDGFGVSGDGKEVLNSLGFNVESITDVFQTNFRS